jgi:hypothetical protein
MRCQRRTVKKTVKILIGRVRGVLLSDSRVNFSGLFGEVGLGVT